MYLLGCAPGLQQHTADYPVSKFKFKVPVNIYTHSVCARPVFLGRMVVCLDFGFDWRSV